jgi:hypothetical protein
MHAPPPSPNPAPPAANPPPADYEIHCEDADGNPYAGPFHDEAAARAWLFLQPNRRHLYLYRIHRVPIDP